MSSIYQDIILDHYHNPRNYGTLDSFTNEILVSNPLCGDKLHIQIIEKDGKIQQIVFSGEGCAISLASASMLTEYAKDKSVKELKNMQPNQVLEMLSIQLSPNRLKCALLSLEGLKKVITSNSKQ